MKQSDPKLDFGSGKSSTSKRYRPTFPYLLDNKASPSTSTSREVNLSPSKQTSKNKSKSEKQSKKKTDRKSRSASVLESVSALSESPVQARNLLLHSVAATVASTIHRLKSDAGKGKTKEDKMGGVPSASSREKPTESRRTKLAPALARQDKGARVGDGPVPVDVRAPLDLHMYSSDRHGWAETEDSASDVLSLLFPPSFFIMDASRTALLASGSLKDGQFSGLCRYCLPEGSYYLRVSERNDYDSSSSGATRALKTWKFCGVSGTMGQEFAFRIDADGTCIADALTERGRICDGSAYSLVTLSGMMLVQNVASETFTSGDKAALANALGNSLYGWNQYEVEVLEAILDSRVLISSPSGTTLPSPSMRGGTTESRRLSSFTYCVFFTCSFEPEVTYDVDGRSVAAVEDLVDGLYEQLSS
eukprot:gene5730-7315_t